MRKIDYQTLALLVRGFLTDDSPAAKNEQARAAVTMLAMCFASRAHVDREEFLKACGVAE